jgi:tripartite-type tricarboxylate transporter receptor subunit TctC
MLKAFLIAVTTAFCAVAPAFAQAPGTDYPTHSIRLIVPFAPGGSTDSLARILAEALSQRIGQSVVVENMAGAGGTIGIGFVAHARPDGYTILSATPSVTINPYIQKDITYDPGRDFAPVIQVAVSPMVLVVPANSPIKSVQDLIDMARAKPGRVLYGSAGVGSIDHLSSALFAALAHVTLTHVPYRGAGPALVDLLAGVLQMQFENAPSVMDDIHGGQLRAIAVGTAKRSALLPNLPTVAQTVPGYEASSWFGILAPAKTPRPVIDKLNAAFNASLADPAVQKHLSSLAVERIGGTPEAFGAYLVANIAQMKIAAKAANLTPH